MAGGMRKEVFSGHWKVSRFERGEVLRAGDAGASDVSQAALVHMGGLAPDLKRRLAFGLHMMAVYDDPSGSFFEMLES